MVDAMRRLTLNLDFALLVAALALINAPLLAVSFIPRRVEWSKRDLIVLLGVAVACLWLLHGLRHVVDGMLVRVPGRDPGSGEVYEDNFLTHGGHTDLTLIVRSWLFGWPTHVTAAGMDSNIYAGLLVAVFGVWSILPRATPVEPRVRGRVRVVGVALVRGAICGLGLPPSAARESLPAPAAGLWVG